MYKGIAASRGIGIGSICRIVEQDLSFETKMVSDIAAEKARFQKAIVSTSANISGEPSPACFAEISDEIKQGVDYIMQSRQNDTSKSKPSQIIKIGFDGQIRIIRK